MKFPTTLTNQTSPGTGTTVTLINEKDQSSVSPTGGMSPPPMSTMAANSGRNSQPNVGPLLSSTPLPATTSGPSTAASMASNFFRRCTSMTEGAAKQQQQHVDLSETPISGATLKTVNETIEPETSNSAEVSKNSGNANAEDIELKPMTSSATSANKKLSNTDQQKQSFNSKNHKPGKSRKNSRAPPPPQMSAAMGGSKSVRPRSGRPAAVNEPVQRPCQTHSFHTDAAEVHHMEEGLLKLLDAFNSGKLRAFGQGCSMEQMEAIRDQQESLAKLHFDLGAKQDPFTPLSEDGLRMANENMDKLMNRLERVSVAIGELNPSSSPPTTPTATPSRPAPPSGS